nr:MAG TPA: hypothetical protein [Caudoviricetes sp.]
MTGCGPAPDSLIARPSRQVRKPGIKRKEGVTFGLSAVNMHPAQAGGRFLHGCELRRSSRFHARPASGCRNASDSRAGCLL